MRRVILALLLTACGGPSPERAPPRAVTPNQNVEVAPTEAPFAAEHHTIDPSCGEHVARGSLQGPNPLLVHGSDAGLVFRTQAMLPGQLGHHLPASMYCYYLQAGPDAPPRAVFSVAARNPPAVAGVVRGDTVVIFEGGGEVHVRLVRADGSSRTFRGELEGEMATPITVYDDGVLLQRVRLSGPAPLSFVPWSESGLALDRRIEVAGAGAPVLRARVCRAGDRLVWVSDRLHVFDLATRARQAYPVERSQSSAPELAVCDDEVAVLRGGVLGGQRTQPAYVIATGAPLPARFAADAVAVRDRYAYVVDAAPTSIVSYELRRYDLERDGAVERVASGLSSGDAIALRTGLYFVDGARLRRIDWATR